MSQKIFSCLLLSCLVFSFSGIYADDGVYVSGDYTQRSSQKRIEEHVRQVVLDEYRHFIDGLLRKSLGKLNGQLPPAFVEQTIAQATLDAIRLPAVQKTIRQVYTLGMEKAIEQIKLKATQATMNPKIQQVVEQAIKMVATHPDFQKVVERTLKQVNSQQSQSSIQQALREQQHNYYQRQQVFQQSVQNQVSQTLEKILKGK